jgi:hypothetical protein
MDVDSLRPGEDWVVAVEGAVTRCDVLLAIIGPDWVGAADGDGNLRLHKELDRVRLEIEAALRNNKPVIPVLVEGASMPGSEDLPETLRPLLRRHAIRVSHATFESDLGALVRALRIIDRSTHGRTTTRHVDEADSPTLVVTPAPEPALPAPPPPAQAPSPSSSASVPITPAPTMPGAASAPPALVPPIYQAPQPLPPPMPQPTYAPPPVVSAYPYAQPAYGYNPTDTKNGPSGVLIGVIALVIVLIVGVGAMFALHIGPFAATAVVTPSPIPTAIPTVVIETPTPSIPPTPTVVPPTATVPATASAPPATPSSAPGVLDHLWAVVPVTVSDSCSEDNSVATPRLYCFIASRSISFWYEYFDTTKALDDEYQSWLTFRSIDTGVANCFDDPMPLPCEGPYKVGGIDPAGQVAAVVDGSNGWLYWTHEQAHVFGTGLVTIGGGQTFDDLFSYWKSDASVLNFTPSPTP